MTSKNNAQASESQMYLPLPPAEPTDWRKDSFRNAVYLGRCNDDEGCPFYYVGQAKVPSRRWDQHCLRQTGPWQFGHNVEWAILAWNLPDDQMDSVESYLIGYVLGLFGCVNGNRGKDERAFIQGFRDATRGAPPQVCPPIDVAKLDWQCFYPVSADLVADNRIIVSEDTDLFTRRWGFHTLDTASVLEPFVSDFKRKLDLSLEISLREQRKLTAALENRLGRRNMAIFIVGLLAGVIATVLYQQLSQ